MFITIISFVCIFFSLFLFERIFYFLIIPFLIGIGTIIFLYQFPIIFGITEIIIFLFFLFLYQYYLQQLKNLKKISIISLKNYFSFAEKNILFIHNLLNSIIFILFFPSSIHLNYFKFKVFTLYFITIFAIFLSKLFDISEDFKNKILLEKKDDSGELVLYDIIGDIISDAYLRINLIFFIFVYFLFILSTNLTHIWFFLIFNLLIQYFGIIFSNTVVDVIRNFIFKTLLKYTIIFWSFLRFLYFSPMVALFSVILLIIFVEYFSKLKNYGHYFTHFFEIFFLILSKLFIISIIDYIEMFFKRIMENVSEILSKKYSKPSSSITFLFKMTFIFVIFSLILYIFGNISLIYLYHYYFDEITKNFFLFFFSGYLFPAFFQGDIFGSLADNSSAYAKINKWKNSKKIEEYSEIIDNEGNFLKGLNKLKTFFNLILFYGLVKMILKGIIIRKMPLNLIFGFESLYFAIVLPHGQ